MNVYFETHISRAEVREPICGGCQKVIDEAKNCLKCHVTKTKFCLRYSFFLSFFRSRYRALDLAGFSSDFERT